MVFGHVVMKISCFDDDELNLPKKNNAKLNDLENKLIENPKEMMKTLCERREEQWKEDFGIGKNNII